MKKVSCFLRQCKFSPESLKTNTNSLETKKIWTDQFSVSSVFFEVDCSNKGNNELSNDQNNNSSSNISNSISNNNSSSYSFNSSSNNSPTLTAIASTTTTSNWETTKTTTAAATSVTSSATTTNFINNSSNFSNSFSSNNSFSNNSRRKKKLRRLQFFVSLMSTCVDQFLKPSTRDLFDRKQFEAEKNSFTKKLSLEFEPVFFARSMLLKCWPTTPLLLHWHFFFSGFELRSAGCPASTTPQYRQRQNA